MSRLRWLGWTMLAVWATWITALQAVVVAKSPVGALTPDLSLLCLLGCSTELHKRDVVPAAVVLAVARAAYSVDSAAALLAAYLAIASLVRGARRTADLGRPLFALGLGALLEGALGSWLLTVHALRVGLPVGARLAQAWPGLVAAGLSTAACALFAGAFLHLPGLTPLRARRW